MGKKLELELGDMLLNMEWRDIYVDDKITECKVSNEGLIWSKQINGFLYPYKSKDGYLVVSLCTDGKCVKYIHTLVAEAFIPNPDNKPEVNHIDGSKENNSYKNLEWVDTSNELRDTTSRQGINNPSSTHTEEEVHKVCKLLEEGKGPTEISKLLNISVHLPNDIMYHNYWNNIASKYNIPSREKQSSYSEEIIHKVCKMLEDNIRQVDIIKELDVGKDLVKRIRAGKTWKHISSNYNIPGTRSQFCKEDKVHEICKLLEEGKGLTEISNITHESIDIINSIKRHRSWKRISKDYKF